MDGVNKTLYIPLYGKAYVSKKGIILLDKKAEEIWDKEGFTLKGKSKSKWLAYYMGMRSAVFDTWTRKQMEACEDAVVIHIGCGMDSRVLRVDNNKHAWFDVDFPQVIAERKKYYAESDIYHMVASDARDAKCFEGIPGDKKAIVVMEGVSMYMPHEELTQVLSNIKNHSKEVSLLMDCYTVFAAKMSKYKNPINDVGVTMVYGMDDPKEVEVSGLSFVKEHEMTPEVMMNELKGMEQKIFKKVYGGNASKKLYRLYEYKA